MSTRIKRPPKYIKDCNYNINVSNTSSRVKYTFMCVLSYNNLSPSYTYFVMSLSSHVELKNYSEVVKLECWRKTIQCEIYALELNQT